MARKTPKKQKRRSKVRQSSRVAPKPSYELKIERAVEHLDILDQSIKRWLKRDAYTLVDKRHADPPRAEIWVKPKAPPPPLFQLLVGDCIHNLRSSLDVLISDLAWRGSAGPVTQPVDRGSAFPIWREPPKQGEVRKRIGTVDPGAQTIVQALQPHDGANFVANDVWLLDELWNFDKHRRLHLTLFSVMGHLFTRSMGSGTLTNVQLFDGPIYREAPLVSYETITGDVDMHRSPRFEVTLGQGTPAQGEPIVPLLRRLHDHVVTDIAQPLSAYL